MSMIFFSFFEKESMYPRMILSLFFITLLIHVPVHYILQRFYSYLSEDLWGLVLSFHHEGPTDQNQVIRFNSKCFYLMSLSSVQSWTSGPSASTSQVLALEAPSTAPNSHDVILTKTNQEPSLSGLSRLYCKHDLDWKCTISK